MKNIFVRTLSLILCVAMVLSFVGCTKREAPENVTESFKKSTLMTGEKLENEKLTLTWDANV